MFYKKKKKIDGKKLLAFNRNFDPLCIISLSNDDIEIDWSSRSFLNGVFMGEYVSSRGTRCFFLSVKYKLNFISRWNYCIYIRERYVRPSTWIIYGFVRYKRSPGNFFIFHTTDPFVISNANITFLIYSFFFSFFLFLPISDAIYQRSFDAVIHRPNSDAILNFNIFALK